MATEKTRATFNGTTIIEYTDGTTKTFSPNGNSSSGPSGNTAYGYTDNAAGIQQGANPAQQQAAQRQSRQIAQASADDEASRLAAIADLENLVKTSQGSKKEHYQALLSQLKGESGKDPFKNLDRWATNTVKQLSRHNHISNGISNATSSAANAIAGVTTGLSNFEAEAIHDIQGWSAGMKKALEPIGLCSAIGDLTEVAKNPLGAAQFLGNAATSIVDKICPGFVAEMDNMFKSTKLEGLTHLPSKMMGSIRSLATAADAILSVPFEIISDVYNGLMDILNAIADLIDGIVSTVMNLAMAVVNALIDKIPLVDELLEFFSAIGELASFVGGLGQMVGGFTAVTNITDQIGSFASSATGVLSNPLGSIPGVSGAISGITGAVGNVTDALRNPEQFFPPGIKEGIQKISSIPGLGFVGNHGYSVGDTLDTLSTGVFTAALNQYTDKLPMIGKFLNKPTPPPSVDIQEDYNDGFVTQKAGPHQVNGAGLPAVASTQKILTNGSITAYGITQRPTQSGQPTSISAYGMTETIDPKTKESIITGSGPGFNLSDPYGVNNLGNPYGLSNEDMLSLR